MSNRLPDTPVSIEQQQLRTMRELLALGHEIKAILDDVVRDLDVLRKSPYARMMGLGKK